MDQCPVESIEIFNPLECILKLDDFRARKIYLQKSIHIKWFIFKHNSFTLPYAEVGDNLFMHNCSFEWFSYQDYSLCILSSCFFTTSWPMLCQWHRSFYIMDIDINVNTFLTDKKVICMKDTNTNSLYRYLRIYRGGATTEGIFSKYYIHPILIPTTRWALFFI